MSDEGNLQVIDVDMMLENCAITIPLQYILTSGDYGVYNSKCVCVCVCVCVFIKLHITAQSGLVILVILCHSH